MYSDASLQRDSLVISLFGLSRHPRWSERARSARQLVDFIDEPGVEIRLVQMLDDQDTGVAEASVESLASRVDDRAIKLLISILAGPDGVGDIGWAIQARLVEMNDRRFPVRNACVRIADETGVPDAIRAAALNLANQMPDWVGAKVDGLPGSRATDVGPEQLDYPEQQGARGSGRRVEGGGESEE